MVGRLPNKKTTMFVSIKATELESIQLLCQQDGTEWEGRRIHVVGKEYYDPDEEREVEETLEWIVTGEEIEGDDEGFVVEGS